MASRSVPALVTPSLLVWAREQAGYTQQEAADRLDVQPERLAAWESGKLRPTLAQARKMADVYHRPLALLFLDVPPEDRDEVAEFRRLPGTFNREMSPQLRLAIRQATRRREAIVSVLAAEEAGRERFKLSCGIDEEPETVAARLRSALQVTETSQRSGPRNRSFSLWREAVEAQGCLVFQQPRIPVDEMRALCVPVNPLPVILINSADCFEGRIFSLLHETVHLMLANGGFIEEGVSRTRVPSHRPVEVFSNAVAAAVLLPAGMLRSDRDVALCMERGQWTDTHVRKIAGRYRVSRECLFRRLETLGMVSNAEYRRRRALWENEEQAGEPPSSRGEAKIPRPTLVLSWLGRKYAGLVLRSVYEGRMTLSDATEHLGLRLEHLERFEKAIPVGSVGSL
jgi:Zn-dependent peptidase ImmA (M78 family)/DNA-binding XRE family transcriptional regulator